MDKKGGQKVWPKVNHLISTDLQNSNLITIVNIFDHKLTFLKYCILGFWQFQPLLILNSPNKHTTKITHTAVAHNSTFLTT